MKPALVMDVMDVMDKSRSYSFRVFHHHSIQGSPPIYPSPEWEFTLFIKTVIKSAEISDDLPPFQACPVITPKHSKTRCGRALGLMELTGVERTVLLESLYIKEFWRTIIDRHYFCHYFPFSFSSISLYIFSHSY
jgi:hypothetical protein